MHVGTFKKTNYFNKKIAFRIIKRVIAVGGDIVSGSPYNKGQDLVVPRGHCWLEGDNRGRSVDSHTYGPVPINLIFGRASFVIWPPTRFEKISSKIPEVSNRIVYSLTEDGMNQIVYYRDENEFEEEED